MLRRDPRPSHSPQRTPRLRKLRNALIAVVAGTLVALIGAELLLRLVLFHPALVPGTLGASLRDASLYADGNEDDDYWKLNFLLTDRPIDKDAPNPDPVTGYTGYDITPGSYAHVKEPSIGKRRPVLVFGDSFAQCMTMPDQCFAGFLERSELAPRFAILNYACGGYGLDQIYLLLKHTLDRFADRDPVVIVGILADGDLDRSLVSFRDWPKPRLEIVGGELVAREPVQTNVRKYLEEHPVSIRSYLWRLFLNHNSTFLAAPRARWRRIAGAEEEKVTLSRRILEEIERELSSRHMEHFYLVFHGELGALKPWEEFTWAENLIEEVCAEHAAPLLDTRAYLTLAASGKPEQCARFYGHGPPLWGHHNALGNRICFEAIRQGLYGNYGPPDPFVLADLQRRSLTEEVAAGRYLGHDALLSAEGFMGTPRAAETESPRRLVLRADPTGATHLRFDLAGKSKRFTAKLHALAGARERCPEQVLDFAVEIDGARVLDCPVPDAEHARELDYDLAGKHSLVLVVTGGGGIGSCSWIALDEARLE